MDCQCNCFGVATAARVPVKRYNLLVPDIYPVTEPPFDKQLGIAIERKFKKLGEYLERNEHRVPKVSRRLARRLYSDLRRQRYGYVKLTVEAYMYLLREGRPEKSSLFANELVVRSVEKKRRYWLVGPRVLPAITSQLGSVVGRLLSHKSAALRTLGVDLLVQFVKLQSTSDFVPQLEGFLPLLCRDANPRLPFNGDGSSAGGGQLDTLRAACLRALLEHLRFCARASFVSHHLDALTYVVLDNIEHAGVAAEPSDLLAAREVADAGQDPTALLRTVSIGTRVGMSAPGVAALLVFEQLSHITRDAAEGKKVVEFVLRYLDQGGRWLGSPVLDTAVMVLRQAAEHAHQHYLLYSGLMRHVAAASLTPAERTGVLELAVNEGRALDASLAAPALLLALKELPAVLAGAATDPANAVPKPARDGAAVPPSTQQLELATRQAGVDVRSGADHLQAAVPAALRQLASRLEGAAQLLEVVGAAVVQLRSPAPVSTAALRCCVSAAEALGQLSAKAAPSTPSSAGLLATFPREPLQRLASIMATWDAAQRLLAHRLFLQLLPVPAKGLREAQLHVLLSALWHEAAAPGSTPATWVAIDLTLTGVLGSLPAVAMLEPARLIAALQAEAAALPAASKLSQLSACQTVAMLLLCASQLHRLATLLALPDLARLAAPGCETVLASLRLGTAGLQLTQAAGSSAGTSETSGPAESFSSSAAAASSFSVEEGSAAAAFLAAWRKQTTQEQERSRLAATLAAAPAFAELPPAERAAGFEPLALAFVTTRPANSGAHAGSAAGASPSEESHWARSVRELYKGLSNLRDASLDGGSATLVQPGGGGDVIGGGVVAELDFDLNSGFRGEMDSDAKTVDIVLEEVEAALEAAEAQLSERSPRLRRGLAMLAATKPMHAVA